MAEPFYRANVLVCGGTGCTSSESLEVIQAMTKEISRRGLGNEVRVVQTGCRGFCPMGPVMIVYPEGIFYCQVQPRDDQTIVEETLVKGRVIGRLTYKIPDTHKELPRYQEIPTMQLNLTGHHLEITPALRDYVGSKLTRLARQSDHVTDVHCILTVEKRRHKAEAKINVSGNTLFADSVEDNMYAAIDTLIDKLDRQIVKHKEKLKAHHDKHDKTADKRNR